MLSLFSAVTMFKLFIYVNNIRDIAGGSAVYVAELTLCFICV